MFTDQKDQQKPQFPSLVMYLNNSVIQNHPKNYFSKQATLVIVYIHKVIIIQVYLHKEIIILVYIHKVISIQVYLHKGIQVYIHKVIIIQVYIYIK